MKFKSSISPFFYPTTVFVVDDNTLFLQSLSSELHGDRFSLKTYDHAQKALEDLNRDFSENYVSHLEEKEYEVHLLEVKIRDLIKNLRKGQQADEVSAVIVDYSMPGMDGLEFCRNIQNPYIQKILLTGEADEMLAVEAFNEGIIDKYIRKQRDNLASHVQESISESCAKYFKLKGGLIEKILLEKISKKHPTQDPEYANFMNRLIDTYHIEEGYLLDSQGSYILISFEGKAYRVFTFNDDYVDSLLSSLDGETIPRTVLQSIAEHQSIVTHCKDDIFLVPPLEEWGQNLHPVIYKGNGIYAALIK